MENFNKLKMIERKVIKQSLEEEDMEILKTTLLAETVEQVLLKKYNKEDSEKLMLIIQKSNVANIAYQMTYKQKYNTFFTDEILNALFNLLFITCNVNSTDAIIEYKNLKKSIDTTVLKVIKKVSNETIKGKIINYLHNKTDADYFTTNFALLIDRTTNIKNKEARILNARKMDKGFLNVIEGCKNTLIRDNLKEIFFTCKNMLLNNTLKDNDDDSNVPVAIISEINPIINEKDLELIEFEPECINEAYIGFLYCLMVDSESASKVFSVINEAGVLNTIFDLLSNATCYTHPIDETSDPDISFLMFGLKMIIRAVRFMPDLLQFFISNCDVFINALWTNLNDKMLGLLFEFVSLLLTDDDVRNKIYDYLIYVDIFRCNPSSNNRKSNHKSENVYDIFRRESDNKCYDFSEGFVRFCSSFVNYKMLESEIFSFFNVAIESSNPNIVILILKKIGENEFLLNNKILTSIKKGIECDDKICDTFIDFIIDLHGDAQKNVLSFVTNDVSFLSLIFSIGSKNFFRFLYLIDLNNIVIFLGDEFLDRLNENIGEGLKFLIYASQRSNEFCRFILRRVNFMNMITNFEETKLKLYNVICDNNINDFEASVGKSNDKNEFILSEIQTSDFYDILSKIVLNSFENKGKTNKFNLKSYVFNEENIQSYCRYIKCLTIIEQNVEKEMNYLISLENNNEFIVDLVSYVNIINNTSYICKSESNALHTALLGNIGSKNNRLFVTKYNGASKFDRYLLFFVLDTNNITKEIYDIVIKQLYSMSENVFTEENSLILRHCLNTLLYYPKLDDVIKFFNGIEVCEKYINKIVMLNIVNLLNENVEILGMNIISKASYDLQAKICFIIWIKQLLKIDDMKNWVDILKVHVVDEEIDYMVKEISKVGY